MIKSGVKRKKSEYTATENYQITAKRQREERIKGISKQPENNKQNGPHLLIITLNINGLKSPTEKEWLNG